MKKKIKTILMVCLAICIMPLTFLLSGCQVKEGVIIEKVCVYSEGKGLEEYGFKNIPSGLYIVVEDYNHTQISVYKAKQEEAYVGIEVGDDWSYNFLFWLICDASLSSGKGTGIDE